jgi:hypothetical protein
MSQFPPCCVCERERLVSPFLCSNHVVVWERAVGTNLWSSGNGSGTLFSDFLLDGVVCTAGVYIDWFWRLCNITGHMSTFGDQLAFATVPLG